MCGWNVMKSSSDRKIADFSLLKIRSRVYFPFTNSNMRLEFYRLFPFLPPKSGKFPAQKGARNRPYTDGISIRKCVRQDERKLNAFQPDQQHTVQGKIMLKELIETMARALVDKPERKLNAFKPVRQHIVQGEITLKELIETMARALVDNPEQVEVSEIEGRMTSIIELRVAKPDIGKVIGKQGRN